MCIMQQRPHIPEVTVHRSEVTENVNLLCVCMCVCVLLFSLCEFCGCQNGSVCISEMSIKFEIHL